MITEGLLPYLPSETVDALAGEAPALSGVRYWLSDITSPAFARHACIDTYKPILKVRADNSLHGLEIMDTLARHGWQSVDRRRYLTDISFAIERIQAAMRNRPAGEPVPSVSPDDPTGIHLFARAA
jgi:O-methyltransferase involved in polyketide biosynthesis